ncbi:Glutathione S-transferase lancl1 [Quaeritorhiza haematococci]|nr:Glutathione S-transferase lancl1 [Quaeritorhiza haematococci]
MPEDPTQIHPSAPVADVAATIAQTIASPKEQQPKEEAAMSTPAPTGTTEEGTPITPPVPMDVTPSTPAEGTGTVTGEQTPASSSSSTDSPVTLHLDDASQEELFHASVPKPKRKKMIQEESSKIVNPRYFPNPYSFVEATSDTMAADPDYTRLPDQTDGFLEQLKKTLVQKCEDLRSICDPLNHSAPYDIYHGYAGIARLLLRIHECDPAFRVGNCNALQLAQEYLETALEACDRDVQRLHKSGVAVNHFGFISTPAGVWATAVAVYHHLGLDELANRYLERLLSLQKHCSNPNAHGELYYGRAGYLYSLNFVRKHVARKETHQKIPDEILENVFETIMVDGRRGIARKFTRPADRTGAGSQMGPIDAPVLWSWFVERYTGAAHGMAGILTCLLETSTCRAPSSSSEASSSADTSIVPPTDTASGTPAACETPERVNEPVTVTETPTPHLAAVVPKERPLAQSDQYEREVKGTLEFLMKRRVPNGNFALRVDEMTHNSSQLYEEHELMGFEYGAPGVALTFCKAYEVFGDEKYLDAAKDAAEAVWQRGIIKDGVGLSHGVAGNAYIFLTLYKLTKDTKYWGRTLKFLRICLEWDAQFAPLVAAEKAAEKAAEAAEAAGSSASSSMGDANATTTTTTTTAATTTTPAATTAATKDAEWSLFEGLAGVLYLMADVAYWNEEVFVGFPCFSDV